MVRMTAILKQGWQLYCQHFGIVAAVILTVWLPLELLSSYMDYFVFGTDDFRKSFRFARFLENFFGIIATAGVISIGYSSLRGEQPGFGSALGSGFNAWGRMWWTRLLTALVLLAGFIVLIIPGVYLSVRLALVEPIAGCERISGVTAMRRSFELTRGRFWLIFRLGLVLLGLFILIIAVVVLPTVLIPALDHWLVDATTQLIGDVLA